MRLAEAHTLDVAAVAQGFIANEAIFGARDPRDVPEAVAQILAVQSSGHHTAAAAARPAARPEKRHPPTNVPSRAR